MEAVLQDKTHLVITYTSSSGRVVPTVIEVRTDNGISDIEYVPASATTAKERTVLLSGDFCQPDLRPVANQNPQEKCTTSLFNGVEAKAITGTVSGPGGSHPAAIRQVVLAKNVVNVTFTAEPDFNPTWLVLQAPGDAGLPFPYVQALPTTETGAVYAITDRYKLCGVEGALVAERLKNCAADSSLRFTPLTPGAIEPVELLSREGDLLFVRMRTFGGSLPPTIAVSNDKAQSTLARLLTKPSSEQSDLDVHLTVMDQETMRRNYGAGLAETYLAVKLDLVNRTEKKLQFNKSAVWFDADFSETTSRYREGNRNKVSNATFDLVAANVYDSPFSTTTCADKLPGDASAKKPTADSKQHYCYKYRFGIEQTERFYADGPLSILGSFDYLTQRTDRALRVIELFGSVLTNLATGGAIAQVSNTAFRDATAVLTGTFIPGSRAIVMNNAEINRQRANLVAQTFQDTVQIAAHATASTVVLLPRDALISMQGYEHLVVLDRLINVHVDPDVVNGIKDPPVPAGKLALGYTRSQVRQALGEPPSVLTNPEGTTTFSYVLGPYQAVNFNKEGQAITWIPRSLADQINLADTLTAAKEVLQANGSTGKQLTLRDDSMVLVDVPDISTFPHYDKNGKHIGTYTLLYDSIQAGKGKSKLAFEKMLGALRLPAAVDQSAPTYKVLPKTPYADYEMPDVKGGMIHVEFDGEVPTDDTKEGPKVNGISFTGEKA